MQNISKAVERKRGAGKKFIDRGNSRHILDSHKYVVQYPDGTGDMLKYSKLVDNLYRNIDEVRNKLHIYSGISNSAEMEY